MTAETLTRTAAAKINLTLEITGRRDDGYHSLQSLVAFTDICDTLTFTPAPTLTLDISGPNAHELAKEDSNLVLKAARFVQTHLQTNSGVSITLEKRIPMAAGLGGGSADAAATVDACMALWAQSGQAPPSDDALAYNLGADVPICRNEHAATMRGIGEFISEPVALPEAWVVMANPGVALSTAAVFNALSGNFATESETPAGFESVSALADFLNTRENSLTESAVQQAPQIGEVLTALGGQAGCLVARMSGSGATCFGLFGTEKEAAGCADRLTQANPEWWVQTSLLKG